MVDGRDVVLGVCTVASLFAATVAGYNFYKDYQAKKQNGFELPGRLGAGSFEELSKSPEFQIRKADMLDAGLPEKRQAVAKAQAECDNVKPKVKIVKKALEFIKKCLEAKKDSNNAGIDNTKALNEIADGAPAIWQIEDEDLQVIIGNLNGGRVTLLPLSAPAIGTKGVTAAAYSDVSVVNCVLDPDLKVGEISSDSALFTAWLNLDVADAKGSDLLDGIDAIKGQVTNLSTVKKNELEQKKKELADKKKENEAKFAALEAALKAQFEQKQ